MPFFYFVYYIRGIKGFQLQCSVASLQNQKTLKNLKKYYIGA